MTDPIITLKEINEYFDEICAEGLGQARDSLVDLPTENEAIESLKIIDMEIVESHILAIKLAQTDIAAIRTDLAPINDLTREGFTIRGELNSANEHLNNVLEVCRILQGRRVPDDINPEQEG